MRLLFQKFGLIVLVSVSFIGCVTNYTPSDYLMVFWENEGNIYSFDKAESITANFIASKQIGYEPEVIFNGNKYKARKLVSINSTGSICKYSVVINGLLNAGEYDLTVNLSNGNDIESIKTKVIVFPSSLSVYVDKNEDLDTISNEEDIIDYLKDVAKDELLEFSFIPSSRLIIPSNQFRIILEGFNKSTQVKGNRVSIYDSYRFPVEADTCSIKIIWINPLDQKIQVQLFPSNSKSAYTFRPSIPRPKLSIRGISRITNPKEPSFEVSCDIIAPHFSNGTSGVVSEVKFDLKELNLNGYQIVPVGDPYSQEDTWYQKYKLQGVLPLLDSIIGEIEYYVSAKTVYGGEKSSVKSMKSNKNLLYFLK